MLCQLKTPARATSGAARAAAPATPRAGVRRPASTAPAVRGRAEPRDCFYFFDSKWQRASAVAGVWSALPTFNGRL